MKSYEGGLLMLDVLPLSLIPTTHVSEQFLKPLSDEGEIECELGLLETFKVEMEEWVAAIRKDVKENW